MIMVNLPHFLGKAVNKKSKALSCIKRTFNVQYNYKQPCKILQKGWGDAKSCHYRGG